MGELICKYCRRVIAGENINKLLEEEKKRGVNYIECPYCGGLMWIKDLK